MTTNIFAETDADLMLEAVKRLDEGQGEVVTLPKVLKILTSI